MENAKCLFCGESKKKYKPLFSKDYKGIEVLEYQVSKTTGIGTKTITKIKCYSCGREKEEERF